MNRIKLFQTFFLMIFFSPCLNSQQSYPNSLILKEIAPEKFLVKFETTKGNFEITIEKKYSPLAVDRFYQLVKSNYFTDISFYRVVANFVAQFGTLDTLLDNAWSANVMYDEPVLKGNDAGTIAFARAGMNSRGSQLFINLKNNQRLDTIFYGDTKGFPAFGTVSKGMDVVLKLFSGYIDEPRQKLDSTVKNVPEFLKKNFPNLDYIKKAYLVQ